MDRSHLRQSSIFLRDNPVREGEGCVAIAPSLSRRPGKKSKKFFLGHLYM